jgi:hypothetical protein
MPKRKNETFDTEAFALGSGYSRPQIASLGQVEPLVSQREWTGIVEFANCVLLFSTLDKSDLPAEHQYADLFVGPEFKWESQNENTQTTPVIQKITSGEFPILLFARVHAKERGGKASPFIYAGRLAPARFASQRPVSGLFDLIDFRPNSSSELDALYAWRPKGGQARRLGPVEQPIPPVVKRPRTRQGRLMDQKKRDLVEALAMQECAKIYEREGYVLENKSKTRPYDYIAHKEQSILRIEVKGTTSSLGKVTITVGELLAVRNDRVPTDLFVLYDISLVEVSPGEFRAEGGRHYKERWNPDESRLRPLQYEYTISAVNKLSGARTAARIIVTKSPLATSAARRCRKAS